MKKNKIVKFGLLGLGAVVKNRVFKLFSSELKDSKVVCVFDKDKAKTLEYSKKFKCKTIKNEKEFFRKILIFVIFLHHREVTIMI